MSKTVEAIGQIAEQDLGKRQEYSEDGVDLSLIRWMLDMTPSERLGVLQSAANSLRKLREAWQRS